jgi:hypothetical protein
MKTTAMPNQEPSMMNKEQNSLSRRTTIVQSASCQRRFLTLQRFNFLTFSVRGLTRLVLNFRAVLLTHLSTLVDVFPLVEPRAWYWGGLIQNYAALMKSRFARFSTIKHDIARFFQGRGEIQVQNVECRV